MNNFYFAYEYDSVKKTCSRLYRFVSSKFEKYDFDNDEWLSSPEQACIFVGKDVMYDELTEDEAMEVITKCVKKTKKNLSVEEAAEMMGKSKQFIRIGLQRGLFPFGSAVKMSSKWTYYISPHRFYDYIGKCGC